MSQFQDLDQVLPIAKKQLPIHGQVVDFPDRISAESGTLLLRIQHRGRERPELVEQPDQLIDGLVDEARMNELVEEVLGRPAEEFLPLVNMDQSRMMHVFQTLMVWHLSGEDSAREVWNNPGKAPGPKTAKKTTGSKARGRSGRPGSRA